MISVNVDNKVVNIEDEDIRMVADAFDLTPAEAIYMLLDNVKKNENENKNEDSNTEMIMDWIVNFLENNISLTDLKIKKNKAQFNYLGHSYKLKLVREDE